MTTSIRLSASTGGTSSIFAICWTIFSPAFAAIYSSPTGPIISAQKNETGPSAWKISHARRVNRFLYSSQIQRQCNCPHHIQFPIGRTKRYAISVRRSHICDQLNTGGKPHRPSSTTTLLPLCTAWTRVKGGESTIADSTELC